jgi:DNA-binding transcriptional LysR family regulator
MDIKRLNTFLCVAEHGTVMKAAQLLNITQPALSRQIASLEGELGFTLFERVGRRLVLTPRGEQFLADCRSLLSHVAALDERVQDLRRGDIKVLRVAASAEPIEALFPAFLHRFAEGHPSVELALIEAEAGEQLRMLERGEVHLSANVINIIQLDTLRFACCPLPQFHVVAASAPARGIKASGAIDIRRLVEQPLLVLKPGFVTRTLFDAACRLAGVRPNIFIESVSAHALLAMAEEDHGVAIVPSIMRLERRPLQVMPVTNKGEPLLIAPAIIWDKRRTLPRYAEEFAGLLSAQIHEAFPGALPATGGSLAG